MSHIKKHVVIPTGALFTASTGEYDYHVMGVFRALKDIDYDSLLDQWLEKHPEQKDEYSFQDDDFFGQCFAEGYFECLSTYNWHLCNYHRASEMEVTEPDGPYFTVVDDNDIKE